MKITIDRERGRIMESSLFLSDLLTRHEPKTRKSLQINRCVFGFMGRWFGNKPVLRIWGALRLGRKAWGQFSTVPYSACPKSKAKRM